MSEQSVECPACGQRLSITAESGLSSVDGPLRMYVTVDEHECPADEGVEIS